MIRVTDIEKLADPRERYRLDVEFDTGQGSLLIRGWLLRRDSGDRWLAFPPVLFWPDGRPMVGGPSIIANVRVLIAIREAAVRAIESKEFR